MPSMLAYRVGAWCWVVTGLGHVALDVALQLAPASADKASLDAALRGHVFAVGGVQRTMLDVTKRYGARKA